MDDFGFLAFAAEQINGAVDDLRVFNDMPLSYYDGADWWQQQEQIEHQQAIFLSRDMNVGHHDCL